MTIGINSSCDRSPCTRPGDLRIPQRRHTSTDLCRLPRRKRGSRACGVRSRPNRSCQSSRMGALCRLLPASQDRMEQRGQAVSRFTSRTAARNGCRVAFAGVSPRARLASEGQFAPRLEPDRTATLRSGPDRRTRPEPAFDPRRLEGLRQKRDDPSSTRRSPRWPEPGGSHPRAMRLTPCDGHPGNTLSSRKQSGVAGVDRRLVADAAGSRLEGARGSRDNATGAALAPNDGDDTRIATSSQP